MLDREVTWMASACGENIHDIQIEMAGQATLIAKGGAGLRFSRVCTHYQEWISISTERTVRRATGLLEVFAKDTAIELRISAQCTCRYCIIAKIFCSNSFYFAV